MLENGVSFRALQWLEWMQAHSDLVVDPVTGARQNIRHAYTAGGEYIVDDRWPVDGFVQFSNGQKLFLEFNGCYWHGCQICGGQSAINLTEENLPRFKRENDEEKWRRLRSLGKLFLQRECEFSFRECDEKETITKIPRVLLNQSESHDTLLEAIRSEQVFGFARVKIDFPPEMKQKSAKQGFLYPPIVRHLKIEEEHLSPYASEQWRRQGQPPLSSTIVQTFSTQDQLLLTSTISYMMRCLGAHVEIHQFFQFVGQRCFTPFCDRVINQRKKSKHDNNPSMGQTAKLVGNSAFGKTIGNFKS